MTRRKPISSTKEKRWNVRNNPAPGRSFRIYSVRCRRDYGNSARRQKGFSCHDLSRLYAVLWCDGGRKAMTGSAKFLTQIASPGYPRATKDKISGRGEGATP